MPITAAAPPARKPSASAAKTANAAQTRNSERYDAINGLGQIAQAILVTTGQFADAGAVGMYFPGIAKEITDLASADERIAKFIDPLIQVGPYAGLIAAILPLGMQIMVNHGRAQAGAMGTVPAGVLEAQMKTRIMQMEVAARQVQREAEAELARMQDLVSANDGT